MNRPRQRERLDKLLVDTGRAPSRERAQSLILAGGVKVGGRTVDKPGTLVLRDAPIEIEWSGIPFVSRGGLKLAGALDRFGIDVSGRVALDVGASTGGFTDCLLRRGAAKVIALDVGYGQIAWSLRGDPRVIVLERTNIRHVEPEQIPVAPSLAVIDVSFISLRLVLPVVARIVEPNGDIVALVKPQFEVGKGRVGKGGVVRDPKLHREAIESVRARAVELGLVCRGDCESPIQGPKGNREFFLWLAR